MTNNGELKLISSLPPIWISHRGLCSGFDENTAGSFQNAVNHGFRYLETDLRVCADDHIVLSHDANLYRVAGIDIDIAKSKRADLECVKLKYGGKLLFFDEFIQTFAALNWTFDFKSNHGMRTVAVLNQWIEKHFDKQKFIDQAKFLLWSKDQERFFQKCFPGARLYGNKIEAYKAGIAVMCNLVSQKVITPSKTYALKSNFLNISLFQKKYIDVYHHYDAKVVAFLPKTIDETKQAIVAGCDEILTDLPIL